MAPGYAPGVTSFGIIPEQRGQICDLLDIRTGILPPVAARQTPTHLGSP
jgi:hypothetical protein